MGGAASHNWTPSQAKYIAEHKERQARIAAKAKPDRPIICLSASARAENFRVLRPMPAQPAPPVEQWVRRQKEIWFSIVEEIDPPAIAKPTIGLIQRTCADYFDISLTALLSQSRTADVVRTRQITIFLCKEMTTRSLPEIGRKFGDRDHTTVLHSVRKITKLESADKELAGHLAVLRERIREAL